jgi:hypothetical protein
MKQVAVQGRRRSCDHFFKIDEVTVTVEAEDGSTGPPQHRLAVERGDSVAAGSWNDAKTLTGLQWLLGRHR